MRFNYSEADNYGGSSNRTNYFRLKNDGDVAKVRFMYRDANDIEGFAVHEVNVNGKQRYVSCLRNYNDPVDNCPLCKAQSTQFVRFFIPIYNVDKGEVQLWQRSKKFMSRIAGLCSRFPNLVSYTFEIERHGVNGSKETTYEIFPSRSDGDGEINLEDLPEIPDPVGTVILDKTAQDMEDYLRNGDFPYNGSGQENKEETTYRRRTPQNTSNDRTSF